MRKISLFMGGALVLLSATTAAAQSTGSQVEEVVVTALKRAENVQDIPKQVQVVAQETLKQNNITSVTDLRKIVPSISGSGLSMRGVATGASSLGANGKVGIVLDDVPIPSRAAFANNLLDIERVEVLPGPQGTLAGRNAAGGLINMVTANPSTSGLTGKINFLATTDFEYQGSMFLSAPITDKLGFSFSQQYSQFRGLTYNIVDGKWAGGLPPMGDPFSMLVHGGL